MRDRTTGRPIAPTERQRTNHPTVLMKSRTCLRTVPRKILHWTHV